MKCEGYENGCKCAKCIRMEEYLKILNKYAG